MLCAFRRLNAPLGLTHRVEVLIDSKLIVLAKGPLEAGHALERRVENALLLREARHPRSGVGALGCAEQPLEHGARVALARQRRALVAPGQRVGIHAAVTGIAGAERLVAVERQLEGRQLRFLAQVLRRDLIHRHAGPDIGALGLLDVGGRQPRRARPRVTADAVTDGDVIGQVTDHEQVVAKWLQRGEDRRHREVRPVALGQPERHRRAVRGIKHTQARRRLRRGARAGERRHHAVQKRERHRGAESAQHRPPGQVLLHHNVHRDSLISATQCSRR